MAEVRDRIDRIDRIDRDIVALLAARAGYVKQAARIKARREDVVEAARIEEVVAKVRENAEARGLSPDLVDPVFRLMIEHLIRLEGAEFDLLHDRADG